MYSLSPSIFLLNVFKFFHNVDTAAKFGLGLRRVKIVQIEYRAKIM